MALPDPPWPLDMDFPRFSDTEYERRWGRLRALLDEAGAGVAIIAGHGAGRAEIQHLSNAPVRWESLMVFPADPGIEPRLLLQLDNHAAGTRPWSIVPVEVAGPDLAARAADLASGVAGTGAVAMLGPISHRLAAALRARLGGPEAVNLGPAFTRERQVKSGEELVWTRYGAAMCDHAVGVFLKEARPGLREDELGAIMTGAVAEAGGQMGICFLATTSMSEGGSPAPRQTWSRRHSGPGDIVMFELSAGFGGATGQVLRTVSLGDDPTDVVTRLHAVADEVYHAIVAAIRPSLPVRELEYIGGSIIEGAGLTIVDDLVHGYGGGYLPPHVRTPATRREDPGDAVLQSGQLLVVQPNVATPEHRFGVQTGDLVVVTDDGAVRLHGVPEGFLRVGESHTQPITGGQHDGGA